MNSLRLERFRRDNRLEDIVMTDADVREQAIKHFFSRALRLVKEQQNHVYDS